MHKAALRHFAKQDPIMHRLARRLGPFDLEAKSSKDPYTALTRAIVFQQLSGKAASTIYGRVVALTPGPRFPTPKDILAFSIEQLRSAGLSRGKASYIQNLAQAAIAGSLPTARQVVSMCDEDLITSLTAIKGVGVWTVQMYLIFTLHRPDILPIGDLGVRKGFSKVYKKRKMPTPKALAAFGERWKPHRTVAAWYLWRAIDEGI